MEREERKRERLRGGETGNEGESLRELERRMIRKREGKRSGEIEEKKKTGG